MSGLRIIGGSARGMRLKSVPGDTTRPITDRVKEALFNIIGADIEDSHLLDLFAGTGSVGIEALSRGAAYVRFNDRNRSAIQTININLKTTGFAPLAEVTSLDSFKLVSGATDKSFDYVYIAPPQYKKMWQKAILELDNNPGWLNPDAWVIVQIHPVEDELISPVHLIEFDRRKYGSTLLIFYRYEPEEDHIAAETFDTH